ncbi:MAG: hypothetical protein HY718_07175, partial [Planctomycetes bacterium]|nr:hypothetical protein [Planctomycetota bacterium]
RRTLAAFFVLLLALCGPLWSSESNLLPDPGWLDMPYVHPLEPLLDQFMWVPQHVAAALCILVLLFLTSRQLTGQRCDLAYGLVAGLLVATAFGCSVWVGGIALTCAAVFILAAILALRPPAPVLGSLFVKSAVGLVVTALVTIPLVVTLSSPPEHQAALSAIKVQLYPTSEAFDELTSPGAAAHAALFWVKFLPLNLGLIAVLGWIGMYARRSRSFEEKALKYTSVGAGIGFLLVAQFLRSDLMNNDLGWRAVLVPVMLLNAWTAALLAELAGGPAGSAGQPA